MSSLAVEAFRPVERKLLVVNRWHVAPAGELLLPGLREAWPERHPKPVVEKLRRAFERALLMAGSKGNWLEDGVAAEVLGGTAFTYPGTWHFGLWTSALTDASNGATAGETTYGSYARVAKTNNTTNFSGTTNPRENSTAITFPQSTSGSSTVTYVGMFDGNAGTSADDLGLWADLTVSRTIDSGETPEFAIGAFDYSED